MYVKFVSNAHLAEVHGFNACWGTGSSEGKRSVRLYRLEQLCRVSISLDLVHKVHQCWALVCGEKGGNLKKKIWSNKKK